MMPFVVSSSHKRYHSQISCQIECYRIRYLKIESGRKLMPTEEEWSDKARRLVKAELKRADVTYDELARRLTKNGMLETKASIANKLSRGQFPATFLLATLKVIGCQSVRMEDI